MERGANHFCFSCCFGRHPAVKEDGGVDVDVVPEGRAALDDARAPPPPVAAVEMQVQEQGQGQGQGQEQEQEQEQEEEGALTYFCAICMERKPVEECFLDVTGCDHVFCVQCIAGYVEAKVGQNAVADVRCPDPDCANGRLEPEDCRPVIPEAVFDRWGAALCEAAVGEGLRFYCPYMNCSALLWKEAEKRGQEPMRKAQCRHCRRALCAQCRVPWHKGVTCEQRRKSAKGKAAKKVLEMAKEKQWQRCPHCGFVVERIDGCVFIRCRCTHGFCYRCASPMNPIEHFCRNCQLTWDNQNA